MEGYIRCVSLSNPIFAPGKDFVPLHGPHLPPKSGPTTVGVCSMETATPPLPNIPVADPSKVKMLASQITEPKSQGGSQAILSKLVVSDEDMRKPQIGISSDWYEDNPCNTHLGLAEVLMEAVGEARMPIIAVSGAISMGTRGMRYSPQARDLIANSIETIKAAQRVYWEYRHDSISNEQRMSIVHNSCPRTAARGGMYTANTMAYAMEGMGMSLPYSSSKLAPLKLEELRQAGKYRLDSIKMDLKPRNFIMPKYLREMAIVVALCWSTNHVGKLGSSLTRQLGVMIRDGRIVPPSLMDWGPSPPRHWIASGRKFMDNVLDRPPEFRSVCRGKWWKMWKDYKYSINKKYFLLFEGALDILQWCLPCAGTEQWLDLVSHWSSDCAQAKLSQNSRNWVELGPLHTTGGRPMQDILHEMEAEGLPTDQISVFERIRNPSHLDIRAIMEHLHARLVELVEAE